MKQKNTNSVLEVLVICANCSKNLNEAGNWEHADSPRMENRHYCESHGICPDCMQELYPNEYLEIQKKK